MRGGVHAVRRANRRGQRTVNPCFATQPTGGRSGKRQSGPRTRSSRFGPMRRCKCDRSIADEAVNSSGRGRKFRVKEESVAWLRVFFRQWIYELIRWPELREHFHGTCWRCMHYKSQHIWDYTGNVKCAAEGGCNCVYFRRRTPAASEE